MQCGELSTIRVMLVDDYAPFRKWLLSHLEINDAEIVCEACDGIQAVQMAKELQPSLIILDIGLPQLNGIEAARQIQKLSPDSKILFMSADTSAAIVEEALSLDSFSYVLKNDAARELGSAVNSALRGERYVSSSVRTGEGL